MVRSPIADLIDLRSISHLPATLPLSPPIDLLQPAASHAGRVKPTAVDLLNNRPSQPSLMAAQTNPPPVSAPFDCEAVGNGATADEVRRVSASDRAVAFLLGRPGRKTCLTFLTMTSIGVGGGIAMVAATIGFHSGLGGWIALPICSSTAITMNLLGFALMSCLSSSRE